PQEVSGMKDTLRFHEESSGPAPNLTAARQNASPPDETGDLKQTPILFLLRRFYRERLSCCIVCTDGKVSKTIYFDRGTVIFANSTLTSERLGEMLIELKRISVADFNKATEIMQAKQMRFGSALIEMGRINPEELKPLIIEQVSNIIYSLFNWSAGKYEV